MDELRSQISPEISQIFEGAAAAGSSNLEIENDRLKIDLDKSVRENRQLTSQVLKQRLTSLLSTTLNYTEMTK